LESQICEGKLLYLPDYVFVVLFVVCDDSGVSRVHSELLEEVVCEECLAGDVVWLDGEAALISLNIDDNFLSVETTFRSVLAYDFEGSDFVKW
jgi:hypothetical protein